MKKILLPILALGGLLFASSCQMDEPDAGKLTGEVDFSITASIPGSINTYASNEGGATNVDKDTYDQRFILEVYDGEAVAYRAVTTVEIGTTASFDVRLLAKKYTFALWADFVKNGRTADSLYNTSAGLDAVTINSNRPAGQEIADAYCYSEEVDLTEGSLSKTFTLKRPFGKIRLVSTDAAENYTDPGSVTVTYGTDILVPTGYNVLTGEAYGENAAAGSYTFTPYSEPVSVGGENKGTLYILGIDYIIASKSATSVSFDVKVDDNGARSVTNIPISANKLTTVIGNFYTNEGSIDVIVEDAFANGEEEVPFNAPITVTSEEALIEALKNIPDNNTVEQIIIIPEDLVIGGDAFSLIINKPYVTIKGANAGDSQTGSAGQTFATSTAENISGYIEGTIQIAADNVTLDGLNFKNAVIINNYTTAVHNIAIRNCSFSGTSTYMNGDNAETNKSPIYIYGDAPRAKSSNIIVENNTFTNIENGSSNASAVVIYHADDVVVKGNTIEGTQYHGVQFNNNTNLEIENNTIKNVPRCAIQMAEPASGNAVIKGNYILNSNTTEGYAAIRVYSNNNKMADLSLYVEGNTISNEGTTQGQTAIRLYNNFEGTDATPAQWTEGCKGNTIVNYATDINIGGPAVDLSVDGNANSYIITKSGKYHISAVKGNSNSTDIISDIASVEVLWESFGTDVAPLKGELISSVSYTDGKIEFSTTGIDGNAVIAVKNTAGTILWSWHIWMTKEGVGEITFNNGKTAMMDRNLGAFSTDPRSISSYGLLYQWGRKDPFLGSSSLTSSEIIAASSVEWPEPQSITNENGTIEYTVANPMQFIANGGSVYKNIDWMTTPEYDRWSTEKTIYDPCPAGWKVPDSDFWSSAKIEENYQLDGYEANINYYIFTDPYCNEDASFVFPGTRGFNPGTLYEVGNQAYYWTTGIQDEGDLAGHAYSLYLYRNDYSGKMCVDPASYDSGYCARGASVRCVKE